MPNSKGPKDDDEIKWVARPWTQEEMDLLHEMVREYAHARWLRKQIYRWVVWTLGLPAAVLMVWEPLVRLGKLLKGLFSAG